MYVSLNNKKTNGKGCCVRGKIQINEMLRDDKDF